MRDREFDLSAAPVNDVGNASHTGTSILHDPNHFVHRPAGGHDIFTHQYPFSRRNAEPATQLHRALIPFREHRTGTQLAPDLLSHHNSSECRGDHNVDTGISKMYGNVGTENLAVFRVLKDPRALEVLVAVQPGCKAEMPLQQSPRFPEDAKDLIAR
jgi:hypothetical protein